MKQYETHQEAQPGKVFWLCQEHCLVLAGTPGVLGPPTATYPTPLQAGATIATPLWFMRPSSASFENLNLNPNSETISKL